MRRSFSLVVLLALVISAAIELPALAVFSDPTCTTAAPTPPCVFQGFEIDGDTPANAGALDWGSPPPNLTHFVDPQPGATSDDIFTGGSKELKQSTWVCTTGSALDKGDITKGDISFRTIDVGGTPHQVLDVDFTRVGTGGSAHVDYEFNKRLNGNLTTGGCTGLAKRSVGDLLIAFDSDNGGSVVTVSAYRWDGTTFVAFPAGSKGSTFEGVENGITTNGVTARSDAGLQAGQFGEGGLDVFSTIGHNLECGEFANIFMKTRSASQINSEVKDRTIPLPFDPGSCPSMSFTKTPDHATVNAGEQIGYTLTATNSGTGTAKNVHFTDALPGGSGIDWSIISQSPAGSCSITGSPPSETLTCNFGDLAGGATGTVHITSPTTAASCTTLHNSVTLQGDNFTSIPINDVTITINCPNVTVTKTADQGTVQGGSQIGFKIKVSNDGDGTAKNVVVSDNLPGNGGLNWSIDPAVTGCSITGAVGSQVLSCTFATMDPHTFIEIHIVSGTTPASCGTVTNPLVTVTVGNGAGDTDGPVSITVACNTDLTLHKTQASIGDQITYTLSYNNGGNADAHNVVISDDLPPGTTFVSCSQTPPCTTSGNPVTSVSWSIGTVAAGTGGSVTLTVSINVTAGCTICNTAKIHGSDADNSTSKSSEEVCLSRTPGPNPDGAVAGGNATGAFVQSSLLSLTQTLPAGDDGVGDFTSVDSVQSGVGSNGESNQVLAVDVPPPAPGSVLHADVLRTETVSTITSLPAESTASSVGSAANVSILNGVVPGFPSVVSATLVRGVARATGTGTSVSVSSLGSAIEGLTVLGIPQAVFPGARVDLPEAIFGAGSYVAIYEETKNTATPSGTSGGTYSGDITVNMIRVHITNMLIVGQAEIIVGHARALTGFPQTTLCGPQANQSVSGSAFMARVLTDPSILPVIVGAVEQPTSDGTFTNSLNQVVVDPLVASKAATTSTTGSFTSINTISSSYAEAKSICVLKMGNVCTIAAQLVRAQANSTATSITRSSNSNGTDFVGLKIGGVVVSLPVPANTVIALPGIGFVILNEQFCDNSGTLASSCSDGTVPGHTGITVRSIHVILLDPAAGGTPGVDIIVAEAHSDARFV